MQSGYFWSFDKRPAPSKCRRKALARRILKLNLKVEVAVQVPNSLKRSFPLNIRNSKFDQPSKHHCDELSAMKPSSNITPPEAPKIYDPDSLSDNDLLWMPLRGLTRNLSTKASERATSTVYLRWLEVHRATPSRISAQWENTVLHWVQSLRARGYLEVDIVNMVRHYEIDNDPRDILNRRIPKREDIMKAYANYGNIIQNKSKDKKEDENTKPSNMRDRSDDAYWRRETKKDDIYRSSSSKKDLYASSSIRAPTKKKIDPEEFLKPPPGNYICNRCGLKGMFSFPSTSAKQAV